ncbi:DUF1624 domain-containing protein [Coriobacteriales bacterium OH1046]|nr:DUF1624 domain-containing protein [Coriobacteriales bacterium OH1046]
MGEQIVQTTPSSNAGYRRIRLFDTLRGASVLSMMLFHLAYDMVFFYGIGSDAWFSSPLIPFWRSSISWSFLAIAGAMCTFSRSNFKRAALYLGVALAIYAATSLIDAGMAISFGIIYCMGACTLAVAILSCLGFAPKGYGWAASFLIAFLMLLTLPQGRISLFSITLLELPGSLYHTGALSWLGIPGVDFVSADYYPLLPYLFLFLAGWSCGLVWKEGGYADPLWDFSIKPFDFLGRHALPIYVMHQPLLLLVCQLVSGAIGR